ncbi:MAG: hypothetical protein NUV56_02540, partial [Candidatus Uhrbacteria bacterium]|nr:hypothetical protein [Candidatus Uhrbacteria bacterium]
YNHHFNGHFGLKTGLEMMRRYGCGEIPQKYALEQALLVDRLINERQVPDDTVPSNALLLARSATPHTDPKCNRAPGFSRYCLTPGLHGLITKETT